MLKALELAQKYTGMGKQVEIISDSLYSLNAVFIWAKGWEAKGWIKKDGSIANLELIQACYALGDAIQVTHVEGHSGNAGNELVDRMASKLKELAEIDAAQSTSMFAKSEPSLCSKI